MTKVTIKDIAKKVGCAPSMVSMAMNDKPGISKDLKTRILKVANQMNWVPTLASATLRKGRSNKILMMLPYDGLSGDIMANNGVIALLHGLTKALENTNFDIDIAFETEEPQILYPKLNRERQPAAFVFMNILKDDWRHRWLLESEIPFVSFGQLEDYKNYNFVDFDNRKYTYNATNLALEKGYKDVILYAPSNAYTYGAEFILGYQQAYQDCGLKYDSNLIFMADSLEDIQNPEKFIKNSLSENLKGKAIVASDETIAIYLIDELRKQGYDINKDIFLIARSSSRILEILAPSAFVWYQDTYQAGTKIAEIITEYLSQDNPEYQHYYFEERPIVR
ncbi:MAG: LacI family DNA-binding transcriptional regulator [Alphaproteobacteria bacterium]